jgi:hypothetical protein
MTASIATLESTFRDAREAMRRADETKQDALKRMNGFVTTKGTIPGRKDAKTKREYEVASAAYARAARTQRIAADNLREAGGDPEAIVFGSKRAAARPNGSTRPEAVYRPDGDGPRFLIDLVSASLANPDARERLNRNNRIVRESRQSGDVQAAGFEAPVWMADYWSDFPRVAAVLESAVPHAPMPARGFLAHLPRVTAGLAVESQQTSSGVNQSVENTDVTSDTADASLVTVAGAVDVDLVVLERSAPCGDVFLAADLNAAVDEEIDRQLAVGLGPQAGQHGEHIGLLNVVGATAITYTDASPSPAKVLAALAQGMNTFYAARKAYPTHVVMSPARAASLLSGNASANAPLFDQGGFVSGMGPDATYAVGSVLGMRVLATGSVPETLGVGSDEDFIALWRPSDSAMATTPARTYEARQILSGTIAVRFTAYSQSYAWLHRRPESVAIVTGTGLVRPY